MALAAMSPSLTPRRTSQPTERFRAALRRTGCTVHDCREGGLAVSLAEMCIGGRIGAQVTLTEQVRLMFGGECGVNRLGASSSPLLPNTNPPSLRQ